jgi:hypothetical protein
MQALFTDKFGWDGRGPELQHIFWDEERAVQIKAVEYRDVDSGRLMHVLFQNPQVAMLTPEEAISDTTAHISALVDCGQSEWMRSFAQRHLTRCRHFRLDFYDERLDIICEAVECKEGPYAK